MPVPRAVSPGRCGEAVTTDSDKWGGGQFPFCKTRLRGIVNLESKN